MKYEMIPHHKLVKAVWVSLSKTVGEGKIRDSGKY